MKKRAWILFIIVLSLLLVYITSVFAAGNIRNVSEYELNLEEAGNALPDLVITKVYLPDKTPEGTRIHEIGFDVENIGLSNAVGQMFARFTLESKNRVYPPCRGIIHISKSRSGQLSKFAHPGTLLNIGQITAGTKSHVSFSLGLSGRPMIDTIENLAGCTRPLPSDEYIITLEVNPVIGTMTNIYYSGRGITESNYANNIYVHKINVSSDVVSNKAVLKFKRGMTAFSLPVDANIFSSQLKKTTGCDIFVYDKSKHSNLYKVTYYSINIDDYIKQLSPDQLLLPGNVYFAKCENMLSEVVFYGNELGPLDVNLNRGGLTLVPTRNYMAGKKLFEFFDGCTGPGGNGLSVFKSITSGQESGNRKLLFYDEDPFSYIIPGKVYAVNCIMSLDAGINAPKWDPARFQEVGESNKKYQLRGDIRNLYQLFKARIPVIGRTSVRVRTPSFGAPQLVDEFII